MEEGRKDKRERVDFSKGAYVQVHRDGKSGVMTPVMEIVDIVAEMVEKRLAEKQAENATTETQPADKLVKTAKKKSTKNK